MKLALILVPAILLSCANKAAAQYVQDDSATAAPAQAAPVQQKQAPSVRLPDIGRPYQIRVTTGVVNNHGWEQAITRKDRNLRHWTWLAVPSFTQSIIGVGGNRNLPARPKNVYKKPANHVPTQIAEKVDSRPGQEPLPAPQSNYIKPNHVPLPVVDHGQPIISMRARWSAASESQLSGKVTLPKAPKAAPVPAPSRAVAQSLSTYGSGYGDVSGRVSPRYGGGATDKLAVHGKLMTGAR